MSESKKENTELTIPEDKLDYLQKELTNIREDLEDDPYIKEAIKVMAAGGLRSTIGSYWNAVVHDVRVKVTHRSLDLFNKEMSKVKDVKEHEDFQNYVTDYDLIEGAYKTGVLDWEGRKLLQQARETRNIFDGHPKSSEPTLFKVFNMIADCNRYVLSQPMPMPIIDIDQYILTMDSDNYNQNEIAIEQALSELPEIYKQELTNKLFSVYIRDNASTTLRSNIEYSFPILWKLLNKDIRKQIGKRYDQIVVEGENNKIERATDVLSYIDGFRYVSEPSRKIIYDPIIKQLEENLDDWGIEGQAMQKLERLGTVIPTDLVVRLVKAMTLTYVGYKGSSMRYSRTDFFSNSAAPRISRMFTNFDLNAVDAFIKTIRETQKLKNRIRHKGQLDRLRSLGSIILHKQNLRDEQISFLELLVAEQKAEDFYEDISKSPS